MWGHFPPSLESTPERLCFAVLVVANDLALGVTFGFGLDSLTLGMYRTIFIGNEGANKVVLQEEVILVWRASGELVVRSPVEVAPSTNGQVLYMSPLMRPPKQKEVA